ncbi:hypothetical protein FRC12_008737 [Ceratobasidium sp. 428]|nr:hypothetical protein FRC12_008737 [Ceratobasidium sp. 428]
MLPALEGRPISYAYHPRDFLSKLTNRVAISVVVSMESREILDSTYCDAINVLKGASGHGLIVGSLKICVVGSRTEPWFPERLTWLSEGWIEEIARKGGTEHLESLVIDFDPPLEAKTFYDHEEVLKRAVELIPTLNYAILGSLDFQWLRHVGPKPSSASQLPDWTPCPRRGSWRVRWWWLETSRLCEGAPVKKEDDVPDLLARLRDLMLTRWEFEAVRPIEWFHKLYNYSAILDLQSTTVAKKS